MQIQYYGLSSFRLQSKDTVVVTDPFHKDSGLTPPRGAADIVVLSERDKPLYSQISGFSGTPFMVDTPGEYDVKGFTFTGIPLKQADGFVSVFLIEAEDMRILNLTHISEWNLSENDLAELGDIDVLLIPVGGNTVLTAAQAAKVVNEVEPKLVIPSSFKAPGLIFDFDPVEKFVKEMGGKVEQLDKISFKRRDLPEEGARLVVLEPLR